MAILVIGSVGLDNVQTPAGVRTRVLGGACTYFSVAASLYDHVSMVAVVGTDFPNEHVAYFRSRSIDVRGLQQVEGSTFFWSGKYSDDLDDVETLDTQLGVFAGFHPTVPDDLRGSEYVFLANIDPDLQLEVLDQVVSPRLVAIDSMNFWMNNKREALTRALRRVDVVILNESEVRMYSGDSDILAGGRRILVLGPTAVVIKRGANGAILLTRSGVQSEAPFSIPAYPVRRVVDPTGAGDTFAAGLMGHLARTGDLSVRSLRQAVVHGAVVASFTIQDFSIDSLRHLTRDAIQSRYDEFRHMMFFDHLSEQERARYLEQAIPDK